MLKLCKNCQLEKTTLDFYPKNSSKDKLRYWCKECDKKKSKENREANPAQHQKRKKAFDFHRRPSYLMLVQGEARMLAQSSDVKMILAENTKFEVQQNPET